MFSAQVRFHRGRILPATIDEPIHRHHRKQQRHYPANVSHLRRHREDREPIHIGSSLQADTKNRQLPPQTEPHQLRDQDPQPVPILVDENLKMQL